MSIFGSDKASAMGVMDQDAAEDQRAYGAALLRRTVQQGNLLRDYPSTVTGVTLPIDTAEEETVARYDADLPLGRPRLLHLWDSPWWPAHSTYAARLRVRMPSSQVVRFWLTDGDETIVTGTGDWQTVSISGSVSTTDRRRTWALWARCQAWSRTNTPDTVVTGISLPYTWTSSDSATLRGLIIPAATFDSAIDTGRYGMRIADSSGDERWSAEISDSGAQADALIAAEPLTPYQRGSITAGDTLRIINLPRVEIAGLTILGGTP